MTGFGFNGVESYRFATIMLVLKHKTVKLYSADLEVEFGT